MIVSLVNGIGVCGMTAALKKLLSGIGLFLIVFSLGFIVARF